ncbi:PTS glucose transporter subunit IIA [Weissella confusa]|uniref:PTS glucose transporter subunit IIA n=1 Tax=Weissella fermenti TaxID=2987699 RepID=A0ABT6D129_9LACO|nr:MULTISPECIES: PTS glucose transporter subunit IIA [Weissella]MBJ7687767.1 PTS glucose transporter subunit IIA [Weissella confusa]MCW0926679.1 PTS glucose transporter subunit IIA [Weissella sp. LMG 11983]MDF9299110.1 PTS glucose transporter subunit IIA [Weissella sp. BK2]
MFGFGKKKKVVQDERLYNPVAGSVVELAQVSDPVFAGGMMGEGFAVEPTGSEVVAPVSGEVTMVQGHAVGFKRADGLEILLHMGIDTVSLDGAPFKITVSVGDVVQGGDVIAVADWAQVDAAGLPKTTMVLITNTADKLASMTRNWQEDVETVAGAEVGTAMAK